jgi:protein-tyrosine phosphatase
MGERAGAAARATLSAPAMAEQYRQLYEECWTRIRERMEEAEDRSIGAVLHRRVVQPLKDWSRRRLERIERRRAEALRRNPAPVTRRLGTARSVLVLCQGNVIRSVLAARLLAAALQDRPVTIRSAGLATQPGWPAHPRVAARCRELDIDVDSHASTAVTQGMVKAADIVLVMEVRQVVAVMRRFPGARRKTFLLTCLAPDLPLEISDPAGKDHAVVDACLGHVERAVKPLIERLAARPGMPA